MTDESLTPAEMGAKGGAARAKSLSPERRSQIARQAVETRWMKAGKIEEVLEAPHNGVIKIGELEIPCAVVDDGQHTRVRVLSETGVLKALGLYRSGAVHVRARDASESGAQLPLFVANKNLKPFVDLELASVLQKPIWYRPTTGPSAGMLHKGVRADLLPKICNVWLKARDADAIRGTRQVIVVANADIISRGLAEGGIV